MSHYRRGAAVAGTMNNRHWMPVVNRASDPQPPPPDVELEDTYNFVRTWFEQEDVATYQGEYKSYKWKDFANYGEVDLSGVAS